MSDTGADKEGELSRLRREHGALTADVERLRGRELGPLRARLRRTAVVVGILALLAAAVVYRLRHWFF